MPRSNSIYRRMANAGEAMFFPSETKVQNSAKYKSYECELQATLTDLRVKYRDFIRKTHSEVLELKQFLNDVQKTRPAAVDLKRIEKRHRQRRLMEQTKTEFIKVRVDNELVTLPILVRKNPEKSEKKHSRKGERKHHHKQHKRPISDETDTHERRTKLKNVGLQREHSLMSRDTIAEETMPFKDVNDNETGLLLPKLSGISTAPGSNQKTDLPKEPPIPRPLLSQRENRLKPAMPDLGEGTPLKRYSSLPDLVVTTDDEKRARKTEKA